MPLEIIKVCGITRVEDALVAAREGATAIGLNFYPGSPRYVDFGRGAMIGAVLPHTVLRVGVFVDETSDRIRDTARAVRLDVVQLHGDEPPFDCEALAPLRVWKAFRVGEEFEPRRLADYPCEAFLLDTDSGLLGGAGRTFPWGVAREAARYGKIIVAGGLDGGNVADAIRAAAPWGVDASSRLERSPGVKDAAKVREFLHAAKAYAGGENPNRENDA
ncbi:MAG: phosphoribosylanthranilate isomerase [Acidobacteria bacterium]|nr:phosphoribosylanthranilate isomerase [Acidobacteriota bacterium]